MKKGFIFDVDGVIADTPHENAWRDSLHMLFTVNEKWKKIAAETTYRPEKFTTDVYAQLISGKPRVEGARSALAYFNVPDPDGKMLEEYCECKQEIFMHKIDRGEFMVFDDALMLLLEARRKGGTLVAASSSKNANQILGRISLFEFAKRTDTAFDFIDRDIKRKIVSNLEPFKTAKA